jgi:hypothetical protein
MSAFYWTHIFFSPAGNKPASVKCSQWLLFVLSMVACIHTHYFSLVFAAGVGITGFFFLRKELIIPYLLSGILIVISFLPEWDIFNIQFSKGDIGGWLAPPGKWFLPQFINHVFNDSLTITIIIAILSLTGFFLCLRHRDHTRYHLIALSWFLFSFLIAYLYSLFRHPVIQYSTLYFTLPFLLYLSGSWIQKLFSGTKASALALALMLITGITHTLFSKGLFHKAQFGVFKDIANDVKRWEEQLGAENLTTVVNVINPDYMNYYFRQNDHIPRIFRWKVESIEDIQKLHHEIDSLDSPYFCFAWSNASHPYEIVRILRGHYPVVKEKQVYFNSAAYLFSKEGISVCDKELMQLCYDPVTKDWKEAPCGSTTDSVIRMDRSVQFGPGFKRKAGDLPGSGYRIFSLYAEVRTGDEKTNASLVISFDTADVPLQYHSLNIDECHTKPGEWDRVWFSRAIESDLPESHILNTYVFNKDLSEFELRNLRITLENWDDPYRLPD